MIAIWQWVALTATVAGALPEGTVVERAELTPPVVRYVLRLPPGFVASGGVDEVFIDDVVRECMASHAADTRVRGCDVRTWDASGRGEPVPLPALLVVPAVPRRSHEALRLVPPARGGAPRVLRASAPGDGAIRGALSGKVVYVSAGHGWYYNASLDAWTTQRGNTHGLVEDLSNAEAVMEYLLPLLRHTGATVFPVRDEDASFHVAFVDDSGGDGEYAEVGPAADFADDEGLAYAPPAGLYVNGDNPFEEGGARTVRVGAAAAHVRWTPLVPARARYGVYVSYLSRAGVTGDAHYEVRHAGGSTHVTVDQRRHGGTWVRLGDFAFDAGLDPERGAVLLHADSTTGQHASADGVRLGGGPGVTSRGGRASGRPRWEEAARYTAQLAGAPPLVYDHADEDNADDVGTRSRFAAWHHEEGEDAVFVSWHSNAPDPGRGTSTWVYGPNPPDGNYEFEGVPGSDRLGRLIQDEIVADMRAAWDPDWRDRGLLSAWFGEINPRHNDEMPSALVEVAFHATEADARQMKEPHWRRIVARAVTQAIVRYFAERDGVPAVLPPEPPIDVRAWGDGDGDVLVAWRRNDGAEGGAAGDDAEGFVVESSADGRTWRIAAETTAEQVSLSGFATGTPLFARVRGANAGGVSMPTEVVGATAGAPPRRPRVLVVNGFDRLDAFLADREDLDARGLGEVVRVRPDRINTFDYVVPHGLSLAAAGAAWDAAANEVVAHGVVPLAGYAVVDWIAGNESTRDETFSDAEQAVVRAYVETGGALLVSGGEVAWDLGARGGDGDRAFLREVLAAEYDVDSSEEWRVVGVEPGPFAGLAAGIDDGTGDTYRVGFPDVLAPVESEAALTYQGLALPAGVWSQAPGRHVVFFGFPLETVRERADRDAMFAAALAVLMPSPSPTPPPSVTPSTSPAPSPSLRPTPTPRGTPTPPPGSAPGGCTSSAAPTPALVALAMMSLGAEVRRRRVSPSSTPPSGCSSAGRAAARPRSGG